LCQDGSKAASCDSGTSGSVSDESVLAISSWERHYWFRREGVLENAESIHGFFWQWTTFVAGIFSGEFKKRSSNNCKVFNVCPEKIVKSDK